MRELPNEEYVVVNDETPFHNDSLHYALCFICVCTISNVSKRAPLKELPLGRSPSEQASVLYVIQKQKVRGLVKAVRANSA